MADILFWPPFPSRERFYAQVFRAVWHFLPFIDRIERIVFPYAGEDYALLDADQTLDMARVFLSRDYDPAIADYAPLFKGKIALVPYDPTVDPEAGLELYGMVVWNADHAALNAEANAIVARTGCEIGWLDSSYVQQETLGMITLALGLLPKLEIEKLLANSVYLFFEHLKRWKGRPMSVFGNGPSLQQVVEQVAGGTFDPGTTLRAVCNSTIVDDAAITHLKPELLFAGDPVQHCGVSLYAGEFRAGLVKALMADERRVFITQLGYVPYFKCIVPPEAHNRIIGVGNKREQTFNIDLTQAFFSTATANIFTMLVLPVAFTISRSVDVYGCDGQPFAKATKPWSHANEDDYMSKMAVTHRLHPAFWKRDYAEELTSYYGDMDDLLAAADQAGIVVRSRTPSYVPALATHFAPG
jgi:hypothetical protein